MIENGLVNIYKPQNYTSHDCVNIVRRVVGIKRVGHTGTLDPMATGVLVVCIGNSTRIMDYLEPDLKAYRCSMQLGTITDTQDIWGQVLETRSFSGIKEEDVYGALKDFKGIISQIPPRYSAVRVNGKRLYQYAREGVDIEAHSREIYIKDITVETVDTDSGKIQFTVKCGKGTYVRTICSDLGDQLGCGGTMCALERVSNGVFFSEDALSIEKVKTMTLEELTSHIYPTDYPLMHFGKAVVDGDTCRAFVDGRVLCPEDVSIERKPFDCDGEHGIAVRDIYRRMYNVYSSTGIFLGTAVADGDDGTFKADKVFVGIDRLNGDSEFESRAGQRQRK